MKVFRVVLLLFAVAMLVMSCFELLQKRWDCATYFLLLFCINLWNYDKINN